MEHKFCIFQHFSEKSHFSPSTTHLRLVFTLFLAHEKCVKLKCWKMGYYAPILSPMSKHVLLSLLHLFWWFLGQKVKGLFFFSIFSKFLAFLPIITKFPYFFENSTTRAILAGKLKLSCRSQLKRFIISWKCVWKVRHNIFIFWKN